MRASGTFSVKLTPQHFNIQNDGDDSVDDQGMFGLVLIEKRFEGDLQAQGHGHMLSAVTATEGSAGYVAIERVVGSLSGRSGGFALQHNGLMDRGERSLSVVVVPDSATGELAGLRGEMTISIVDRKHYYEFDYRFESV